jgi:Mrp family chromosome partitioning ATPase
MKADRVESLSLQLAPTVFGAVRRYWIMVVAVAMAALVAAVAYSVAFGKVYRAEASVTVPAPAPLQGQQADAGQYLDSQVLLLQSQDVAQRAASIANRKLGGNMLTVGDFIGAGSKLVIAPPTTAAPGAYGASIVALSFSSPDPKVAQAGVNAVLQAFDDARSAATAAQANATIAGIDQTLARAGDAQEQQALMGERAQVVANEQLDLAAHPTLGWAAEPTAPLNGGLKLTALIGLVIGVILGGALAYARASRRRGVASREDPAVIYGAPLLGEFPAFPAGNKALPNGDVAGDLFPVITDPHSVVAEAFRFAAGSIEQVRALRGPRLSLVFVSPGTDGGKGIVVANLAFALAEGGTQVLVINADPAGPGLTTRLLGGTWLAGDGLEEILAGRLVLADCVQPSTFNAAVGILGCGPGPPLVTGAARAAAADALLTEAEADFDLVLIDGPDLLQTAGAAELVGACDAAITVVSPDEPVRDHAELADRIKLTGTEVIACIWNPMHARTLLARFQRSGSAAARSQRSPAAPGEPSLVGVGHPDRESRPSSPPVPKQEPSPFPAPGPSQPSGEG